MASLNTVGISTVLLSLAVLVSGCSSNFSDAINSVKEARALSKGLPIPPEYIQSLPYASAIVRINDQAPILIILSSAKYLNTKKTYSLTWVSTNKAAIVTENGRIIRTIGLKDNLEQLSTPNSQLAIPGTFENWSAIYDWSPGYRYNFEANIHTSAHELEQISTQLWTDQAQHISEKVTFNSFDTSFTNHFWRIPERAPYKSYIIKTIQYIGPNMDKIEMLFIKPFLESLTTLENNQAAQ